MYCSFMVNVVVQVPEEKTLEQVVDTELNEFETYFIERLKNTRLTPSERSIVKTYLYYASQAKNS